LVEPDGRPVAGPHRKMCASLLDCGLTAGHSTSSGTGPAGAEVVDHLVGGDVVPARHGGQLGRPAMPARLEARPGLTLVTGTPEREADIEHAFAVAVPADGVVIALNNVRTSDMPWARQISPPRFMADAVRYTTDAMNRHGVERIAVISAFSAGDSLAGMPSYLRWLVKHTNLGKTYADHNLVDAEIRTTQTAWTLVRAVGLSNSDKLKTLHTTEGGLGGKPGLLVSRRAVARFAVDAALGGGWAGRAPIIWEK
jgi:hypothetical protein